MNGARLTLTFDLRTAPSVERAVALIERWLDDELGTGGQLAPLAVASVRIAGDRLPIPDSALMLARRRKDLHLRQEDLARLAGVGRTAVTSVERGETGSTSPSAIAIRRALDAAEATR